MPSNLYEMDFYAWTLAQARLVQDGDLQPLDIPHSVEKVESLGKQ
jgi:hypothetical protein